MTFYAHTANHGHPRPADGSGAGSGGWQTPGTHRRNLATLAQPFAAPLGRSAPATRQPTTTIVAARFISSVLKTTFPEVTYGR